MFENFFDPITILRGMLFATMGILFGFSLIGIEFLYKFSKYGTFETKRWKYSRVKKEVK